MPNRVIYEPKGSAKEYADLALNLYIGCNHGCKYCFVPGVCKITRENFNGTIKPKKDIITRLIRDLELIEKNDEFEKSQVLMSFTSDPYQPLEEELKLTRTSIKLLNSFDFPVRILTKGEDLAQRDFDLLSQVQENEFGITLVMLNEDLQKEWEPFAASPKQRIENLRRAKKRNIKTWLSLEPIIDLQEALDVIDNTHEFTDFYGVGKLNYNKHQKTINWKEVKEKVEKKLNHYGKKYMIHKSLEEVQ
ncbi:radical SAM protein [archaeon]|nr:radical SAM protein [archaeon]